MFQRITIVLTMLCLTAQQPGAALGQQEARWFKGNLHTHSLWSDGNDFPEVICAWYKQQGYDFVALSDHNTLAEGVKWMKVRDINRRGGAGGIDRYIKQFGEDWVETRGEGAAREVRLKTFKEYRPRIEEPGKFLLIQAEEITDSFEKKPVHMNATNLRERIKPQGGKSVRDTMRNNLRAVREQAERLGIPILTHLNHPNFRWGITAEDLAAVVEEPFFEVFNGHPGVAHLGDDKHVGVERMWDIANTLRIAEYKAPPLYGLGTDDSHNYFGQRGSSPGRGWVMVRAKSLDTETLLNAMTAGDFYASSGVTLRDVRYDKGAGTLTVEVGDIGTDRVSIQFIGTRKNYQRVRAAVLGKDGKPRPDTYRYPDDIGETFKTVFEPKATYQLKGDELYVRAMVTLYKPPANPVWKSQRQQAWTQPVGWEKWIKADTPRP